VERAIVTPKEKRRGCIDLTSRTSSTSPSAVIPAGSAFSNAALILPCDAAILSSEISIPSGK
jgi:hypothetical protein